MMSKAIRRPARRPRPPAAAPAPVSAALVALAVLAGLGTLAGCGTAGHDPGAQSAPSIGVLMPDTQTARWEEFDDPFLERYIKDRCPRCTVESVNAQNDVAVQQRQMMSMITAGYDVLILSAVDATAIASSVEEADREGIPVIAYDRMAQGPIDAYVSFDNSRVGELQGYALLGALAGVGRNRDARIVLMNGSATDPNAEVFARGARQVLAGQVDIVREFDTPGWAPRHARLNMSGALADLGPDHIDGVLATSDGLAAGVIAAYRAAQIDPPPPVTGQDAELAAIQRILEGDQYMTVYKPYQEEARPAAAMAVALARGESPDSAATTTVPLGDGSRVPAVLAEPLAVTAGNVKSEVVGDGLYTAEDICTPRYEEACRRNGLLP